MKRSGRLLLLLLIALGGSGFRACDREPAAPVLQVALRSTRPATSGDRLFEGNFLVVVRLEASSPITIASAPAREILEAFDLKLAQPERPTVSGIVTLPLPVPDPALSGVALDVALIDDANDDGAWQPGEAYITAWTGGRGSYRLIHDVTAVESGRAGGWTLLEGGEPPIRHSDLSNVVIYIDPVSRAIER